MNKERGEETLEVGGELYRLVPTFEAMANVEGLTGEGIFAVGNRAYSSASKFSDVVAIVHACMYQGHDHNAKLPTLTRKRLEQELYKKGILKLGPMIVRLMQVWLTGKTAEEVRAERETSEGDAEKKESATDMPTP